MPTYITDIQADGDLNTALINFGAVCTANVATLGLTPGTLSEITGAATDFTADLNAQVAAKAAAKAATTTKDKQKADSRAVISKWAKTFRANEAVPDTLLNQLMLPSHSTPGVKTPPTTPTALVASADGTGLVSLNWNRTGNRQGTTFQIEYRLAPTDPWAVLNTTTKVKFSYQATPGAYIAFRVAAQRHSQTSAFSTPVSLWEGGGAVELKLAA